MSVYDIIELKKGNKYSFTVDDEKRFALYDNTNSFLFELDFSIVCVLGHVIDESKIYFILSKSNCVAVYRVILDDSIDCSMPLNYFCFKRSQVYF